MKTCPKCEENKPVNEFLVKDKKTGRLNSYCKSCHRVYSKVHYRLNKKKYIQRRKQTRDKYKKRWQAYKNTLSCSECGENRPGTLDFHHIENKDHELANMVARQYSWNKLMEEIAKCIVLCANCHRVLHYKERKNKSH